MKRLYMETTKISAEQTVAEIQKVLGKYGAGKILTEYKNGEIIAVSFSVNINDNDIPFKLPCRWKVIYNEFASRRIKYRENSEEKDIKQAKRTAWRQILRWVEAQLALVNTNMVKIQEVFMPYIQVNIKQTLYEKLEEEKFKMIEYEKKERR